jgi:hypothetical protein
MVFFKLSGFSRCKEYSFGLFLKNGGRSGGRLKISCHQNDTNQLICK